ncbi:efflux RND transporter periplasmic adaptor subunit [Paenibacillus sp. GD4]|uniref:efflux RND transporter periplasmic adaptor subunit n=1 Tax=Paenibacillus sp. GD4 TaxID=3068890 RepID=UPI002796D3C4|nr:efflux RND transporter periplasmic adaptor subunit [Paenibacillus sp. GD4]MDQ1914453.1 efflux RND transporter periplasmic adaptor subunit [Paenibacillus sp. GD4]
MKNYLHILTAAAILSASTAALTGCNAGTPAQASSAGSIGVKVITLSAAAGVPGASGKIAPLQTVHIYSKLPGRVAEVFVDEGSKVKKGDVLLQLDTADLLQQQAQAQANVDAAQAKLNDTLNGARPQDLQAAEAAVTQARGGLDTARAAVEQAKAVLDLATKTHNQLQNRYDEGLLSKDELEAAHVNFEKASTGYNQSLAAQSSAQAALSAATAKLELSRAGATSDTIAALRAQVDLAKASLELSKNAIDNAAIKAPSDGIVVKRSVQPGEMAFTSMPSGTELLTMVSMDSVKVEVSVPESLIGQVKEGAEVKVTVPSVPNKTFDGVVSFVSPVSDANNNTFPVKVLVKNSDESLRAGAVASVAFGASASSRVELPKSALLKSGGGTFVYRVSNGVAQKVQIQVEEKNEEWVYVKGDSLKSNDQIVLKPGEAVTDGAKVHAE